MTFLIRFFIFSLIQLFLLHSQYVKSTKEYNNELMLHDINLCFNESMSLRINASEWSREYLESKLFSNDPFVELFNIFDSTDLININLIHKCVKEYFPSLTQNISSREYYGAGNLVTSINGCYYYYYYV